jgi:hypothetical protein
MHPIDSSPTLIAWLRNVLQYLALVVSTCQWASTHPIEDSTPIQIGLSLRDAPRAVPQLGHITRK